MQSNIVLLAELLKETSKLGFNGAKTVIGRQVKPVWAVAEGLRLRTKKAQSSGNYSQCTDLQFAPFAMLLEVVTLLSAQMNSYTITISMIAIFYLFLQWSSDQIPVPNFITRFGQPVMAPQPASQCGQPQVG